MWSPSAMTNRLLTRPSHATRCLANQTVPPKTVQTQGRGSAISRRIVCATFARPCAGGRRRGLPKSQLPPDEAGGHKARPYLGCTNVGGCNATSPLVGATLVVALRDDQGVADAPFPTSRDASQIRQCRPIWCKRKGVAMPYRGGLCVPRSRAAQNGATARAWQCHNLLTATCPRHLTAVSSTLAWPITYPRSTMVWVASWKERGR